MDDNQGTTVRQQRSLSYINQYCSNAALSIVILGIYLWQLLAFDVIFPSSKTIKVMFRKLSNLNLFIRV
jgi:hypothetical protein